MFGLLLTLSEVQQTTTQLAPVRFAAEPAFHLVQSAAFCAQKSSSQFCRRLTPLTHTHLSSPRSFPMLIQSPYTTPPPARRIAVEGTFRTTLWFPCCPKEVPYGLLVSKSCTDPAHCKNQNPSESSLGYPGLVFQHSCFEKLHQVFQGCASLLNT